MVPLTLSHEKKLFKSPLKKVWSIEAVKDFSIGHILPSFDTIGHFKFQRQARIATFRVRIVPIMNVDKT